VASSSAGYPLDSNCQLTGTNISTNTSTRICTHRTWLVLDNLLPIRQLEIDLVQVSTNSTNSPLDTWPFLWELTLGKLPWALPTTLGPTLGFGPKANSFKISLLRGSYPTLIWCRYSAPKGLILVCF
jgi:hypothetical protein